MTVFLFIALKKHLQNAKRDTTHFAGILGFMPMNILPYAAKFHLQILCS